jgi:thiol-disulfide isomerase/thioredoxin
MKRDSPLLRRTERNVNAMGNVRKNFIKTTLLAIVAAAVIAGCQQKQTGSAGDYQSPKPAPEAVLKSMDGTETKLSALKGKPVVLEFFATWCPTCMSAQNQGDITAFYDKYNGDVLFYAVNLDQQQANVEKWAKAQGIKYPIVHDDKIASDFEVTGIPHVVGINGKGEIIYQGLFLPDNKDEMVRRLKAE